MRLDKFIADNSLFTRSELKKLATQKKLSVNGITVVNRATQVTGHENITVGEQTILPQQPLYIKMHKSAGVVCATTDLENPTVIETLYQQAESIDDTALILAIEKHQLQIVGRLDKDTTGILLLTTDGEWNHKITSPKSLCEKTYRVDLAEPISESNIQQLTDGVLLKGEIKLTHPAKIIVHSDTKIDLTICEGKYHQIKRMLAAVGNKVVKLQRISVGTISLNDTLTLGQFSHLNPQEIDQFNHD